MAIHVDLDCTKRNCPGAILVRDEGEIYDGHEGVCDTCGRVYVATEFEDGTMRMVYDRTRTQARQRAQAKS